MTPTTTTSPTKGVAMVLLAVVAFVSLLGLRRADAAFGPAAETRHAQSSAPNARLAVSALGRSGSIRMRFALPGERIQFPIELQERPNAVAFEWIPLGAFAAIDSARSVAGTINAPRRPGFYRLAVVNSAGRTIVDGMTLAVIVPFSEKRGATLNGYKMGYYRGEQRGATSERPVGFLEIGEPHVSLEVSEHMILADFITHDAQTAWPRYVALDGRLIDKLELVFREISSWQVGKDRGPVEVDVHSGFRTPLYNQRVPRAAGDSRHQFGDAADVAVDANRDGRVDAKDIRLIELAVEIVERRYPDLLGGLGVYTQNGSPYAHIDARGTRARWRG